MEGVPTKLWRTPTDKDDFICVVLPMPWSEKTWDSQVEIMMKFYWYLSCLETIQDVNGVLSVQKMCNQVYVLN